MLLANFFSLTDAKSGMPSPLDYMAIFSTASLGSSRFDNLRLFVLLDVICRMKLEVTEERDGLFKQFARYFVQDGKIVFINYWWIGEDLLGT